MDLYTPTSLKQHLWVDHNEWVGEYHGFHLKSAFQPILFHTLAKIYGYEGLVRVTRQGVPINPLDFFSRYIDDTEIANVEALCASLHVRNFARANMSGNIFLNSHPTTFARIANDQYSVDKAVDRICQEGMKPENVVWEITEFKESDRAKFLLGMNAFRATGSLIAMDDYGQLESNEARIELIKPDIVKIDRELLQAFCATKQGILKPLAERLYNKGFKIVLEGVETQEEHDALQVIPHHFVQGYLYGRPASAKDIIGTTAS
jgi:EAL domain-containing protein (putative c-di-GMP-specific phosphodiesterase class I)